MRIIATTAILIAIATPAYAQETFPEKDFGRWTVYGYANDCWMTTTLEDGVDLKLSPDRNRTDLYFTLRSEAWTSIEKSKRYPIRIEFGSVDEVITGFGSTSENLAPGVGMFLKSPSLAYLPILEKAPTIRFSLNGKPVVTLSLTGSAPAFAYFRQCIKSNMPGDPFASAKADDPFK